MIIFAIAKMVGAVAIAILTLMSALHINHARMVLHVTTWTADTSVSVLQAIPDETVKLTKRIVKLIHVNMENALTDMPGHHANATLDTSVTNAVIVISVTLQDLIGQIRVAMGMNAKPIIILVNFHVFVARV